MRSWAIGGALIIALAVVFLLHISGSRYWAPRGAWGPAYSYGYGMGPWMMNPYSYGMGPWMMGPGMMGGYGGRFGFGRGPAQLNLTANDVKTYVERSIAITGNPYIKVGTVTEKDADTITADIVTTDKEGLVERLSVNRHTGFFQPEGT